MREIEVKTRLRDPEEFLRRAAAKGIKFDAPIMQEDVTFLDGTPKDDPAWNIIRLRKQGGRTILTMKYKASDRSRDNHELETEVKDFDQVEQMLGRLGYSVHVHIVKQRRFAHFDGLELCFDDVKDLGMFAEVEKLVDDTKGPVDIDAIQAELWGILEELGARSEDRTHLGYDQLMAEYLKVG